MPPISERILAALGSSYTIERELTGGGMARVFATQAGTVLEARATSDHVPVWAIAVFR